MNETRCTRCLERISKYWGIPYRDRFARLHYSQNSETFFRKVIIVLKMAPLSQSHINSIRKLNNIIVSCLTYPRPSVINNRWRHDTSQDWEYLAKNYNNFTTTLIPDKTLLRLGFHILSIGYLEDRAPCFTKVTEDDNTSFNREMVEDEVGKEDGKEAVTDSEEEACKK